MDSFIHLLIWLIIGTEHCLVHISSGMITCLSYLGIKWTIVILFLEKTHCNINVFHYWCNSFRFNDVNTAGVILTIYCWGFSVYCQGLHIYTNRIILLEIFLHAMDLSISWIIRDSCMYTATPRRVWIITEIDLLMFIIRACFASWCNSRKLWVV